MSHFVVIGAGFGGLTAIRELRKRDAKVEITLVAPQAEFLYLPSLIWIPSGLREPGDLKINLEAFLKRHRVNFHRGRVTGLREGGRVVVTDAGEVRNDGLIIASGGRFMKKLPGIEHSIAICEGVDAAMRIRDRLRDMSGGTIALGFAGNPLEPSAMRGGPIFELLFCLRTQLKREKRLKNFKFVFFSPAPRPGERLGPKAVDSLLRRMHHFGVETHLGAKILHFAPGKILTERAEIAADLILFMPGMTGPDWAEASGLTLTPSGHFKADEMARVEGAERVYAVGDGAAFPGPQWQAKQAHAADLQAVAAAENLLHELKGVEPTRAFKHEIICIVDTLDKGMLVFRDEKRALALPPSFLGHWAKRIFEKRYLAKLAS